MALMVARGQPQAGWRQLGAPTPFKQVGPLLAPPPPTTGRAIHAEEGHEQVQNGLMCFEIILPFPT